MTRLSTLKMGIEKLNPTISRIRPPLTKTVSIMMFAGHYVAIDFSIMLHQCYSNAHRAAVESVGMDLLLDDSDVDEKKIIKRTTKAVLQRISNYFVRHGIKPVIVIEGACPELKKKYAHPKRQKAKKSAIKRLNSHIKRLKKEGITFDNISASDFKRLISLKCQTKRVSPAAHDTVIEALRAKGYPVLQATGEAEELCTKLCLDGHVKAVYSTDSDNIVRRCPMLITKVEWPDASTLVPVAHTIRYKKRLHETFGLDYTEFVDYCIMMGCDYNQRIWGMKEQEIIQLLFLYGSIEEIEKREKMDLSSLNYQQCRDLFKERSLKRCCANWNELTLHFRIKDL